MADQRMVAISTDSGDMRIYGGPNVEFPATLPADRRWVEEYRALSAGYSYPDGYVSEAWAQTPVPQAPNQEVVRTIRDRLQAHLAISSRFLRDLQELPEGTPVIPDVAKVLARHERALNLSLRVLLEVFDTAPPTWVTKDASERRTDR